MEVKLFEVIDHDVHVPVVAIRCNPANEGERRLLAHAGYGLSPLDQSGHVLFVALTGANLKEGDGLCLRFNQVHDQAYIADNWDTLYTGSVLDVEFMMGERITPRASMYPYA